MCEELRMQDESKEHVSKIHVVEDGESSHRQKWNKVRPNKDNSNKGNKIAKEVCWKCNELGDKKRDYTI